MIKKTKDNRTPKGPYKVKKFYVTSHAVEQMNKRKITKGALYYNLTRKPLAVTKVKFDEKGRPSYRKTTKNKITSAINPENHNVVSVNKLHTKTYKKLIQEKQRRKR